MSESRALAKPSPAAGPLRPEPTLAHLATVLPFPLAAILVYNFQHWTMSGLRQMDKNASAGTFAVSLEALSGEELAHTIVQLHPDIARGRIADRLAIAQCPGDPAQGKPLQRLRTPGGGQSDVSARKKWTSRYCGSGDETVRHPNLGEATDKRRRPALS